MRFEPNSDHTRDCSQQGAEVSRQSAQTFTLRVVRLFERNPGRWINALELQQTGGLMAWRTRVSDARRLHQMKIENRVTRTKGGIAKSEYKFTPEHAGEHSGRLF